MEEASRQLRQQFITAAKKSKTSVTGKFTIKQKKGGLVYAEILLHDNTPAEFADRAVLWNAVEKIE